MRDNKIPKRYDRLIYEGYEELLAQGYNKLQCHEMLNERFGTDFPESSMRGRYEKTKLAQSEGIEAYNYENQLYNIATNRLRLREDRKVMNKERSMVDSIAKQYMERKIVAEMIRDVWKKEVYHEPMVTVDVHTKSEVQPVYAFGDVHWGYISQLLENKYDPIIAFSRLKYFFEWVKQDIKDHGYEQVILADLGDPIEGSALRISQLLRIAETMSTQAKQYTNAMTLLLKDFAKTMPNVQIRMLMVSEDNHGQLRLFNTKRDELPENLLLSITNDIKNTIDTAHEFGGMMNMEFITGDEIVLSLGSKAHPYNTVFAHGHQYGRADDILHKVEQRHGVPIHLFVAGHWHQFSIKYKNVKDRGQQALIFLPSMVGDTDFSEHLFLSCYPAFLKITVNLTNRVANATLIRV